MKADMNAQVIQTNIPNEGVNDFLTYRPYIIADDREREVIAALGKHPADVVPRFLGIGFLPLSFYLVCYHFEKIHYDGV